ncbi:MAG: GNAT family N-acetyltransferase [Pseudomonadota bacterium]
MEVHTFTAAWETYKDTLRELRRIVFIEEQEVPKTLEWDGRDESSTHFLAVTSAGQHIGCARLLPEGQIGRMAVLEEHRGKHIGAQLLEAAVAAAQAQGFDRVFLHAQSYAEPFYRRGGFLPYGEEFEEAGIPHIAMERMLEFAYTPPEVETTPSIVAQDTRPALIGVTPNPQPFEDLQQALDGLLRVIASARRRLVIMSPELDHDLFAQPAIVEQISRLARSAAKVEIQILLLDSRRIVQSGHPLVELARRLDQKMAVRRLDERANSDTSSFVCADLDAYWLLPSYDQYEGVYDLANPVTSERFNEVFKGAWENSSNDPDLRILRL